VNNASRRLQNLPNCTANLKNTGVMGCAGEIDFVVSCNDDVVDTVALAVKIRVDA